MAYASLLVSCESEFELGKPRIGQMSEWYGSATLPHRYVEVCSGGGKNDSNPDLDFGFGEW